MSAQPVEARAPTPIQPPDVSPVQVYATIKRSSKYRDQQRGGSPFPVHFDDYHTGYIVFGGANQYRVEDLRFYIKAGGRFVVLS